MTPINQEHKEAEQLEADKVREGFVKSMSKDAQDKFAAIQQAVEILVKADLKFYLFPMLPCGDKPEKDTVWQWNSLIALMKYDEAGKLIDKSLSDNVKFHDALFYEFFGVFKHLTGGKTYTEAMDNWAALTHASYVRHYEYLTEKSKTNN